MSNHYLKVGDEVVSTSVLNPEWSNVLIVQFWASAGGLPRSILSFAIRAASDFEEIKTQAGNPFTIICWGDGSENITLRNGEFLPWPDSEGNPVSSSPLPVTIDPYLEGYWIENKFTQGWRTYVCTFLHELWLLQEYTKTHTDRTHVHVSPYTNHSAEDGRAWGHVWKFTRAVLGATYQTHLSLIHI